MTPQTTTITPDLEEATDGGLTTSLVEIQKRMKNHYAFQMDFDIRLEPGVEGYVPLLCGRMVRVSRDTIYTVLPLRDIIHDLADDDSDVYTCKTCSIVINAILKEQMIINHMINEKKQKERDKK